MATKGSKINYWFILIQNKHDSDVAMLEFILESSVRPGFELTLDKELRRCHSRGVWQK